MQCYCLNIAFHTVEMIAPVIVKGLKKSPYKRSDLTCVSVILATSEVDVLLLFIDEFNSVFLH